MFGLFTEKDVRKLIARLREESAKELAECRAALAEIKEENRRLRARLSVLEGERDNVSAALIRAVEEGERIERESRSEGESKMREAVELGKKFGYMMTNHVNYTDFCRIAKRFCEDDIAKNPTAC